MEKLEYGGSYHDKDYSEGKNLTSIDHVMNVVNRSIDGGHFPRDQNGIYLVLGSRFEIKLIWRVCSYSLFPFLCFFLCS